MCIPLERSVAESMEDALSAGSHEECINRNARRLGKLVCRHHAHAHKLAYMYRQLTAAGYASRCHFIHDQTGLLVQGHVLYKG